MSLKTVQLIVGRLVTDEEYRLKFLSDPIRALTRLRDQGVELTSAEIDALIRTDPTLWSDAAARSDPTSNGRIGSLISAESLLTSLDGLRVFGGQYNRIITALVHPHQEQACVPVAGMRRPAKPSMRGQPPRATTR
jgi:hypothetical protein